MVTPVKVPPAASVPVRMSVTALVSLASTSVSFVSTLPLGLIPGVALAVPPASTATVLSLTANGLSLVPRMMMVRVAVLLAPARSRIW
ncbi:hypothetical protein D9M71_823560 [compost metagenome]